MCRQNVSNLQVLHFPRQGNVGKWHREKKLLHSTALMEKRPLCWTFSLGYPHLIVFPHVGKVGKMCRMGPRAREV